MTAEPCAARTVGAAGFRSPAVLLRFDLRGIRVAAHVVAVGLDDIHAPAADIGVVLPVDFLPVDDAVVPLVDGATFLLDHPPFLDVVLDAGTGAGVSLSVAAVVLGVGAAAHVAVPVAIFL